MEIVTWVLILFATLLLSLGCLSYYLGARDARRDAAYWEERADVLQQALRKTYGEAHEARVELARVRQELHDLEATKWMN